MMWCSKLYGEAAVGRIGISYDLRILIASNILDEK